MVNELIIATESRGTKGLDLVQFRKDFRRAHNGKKKWNEEACRDFEFYLGKQWEDEDLDCLKKQGVKGLTINKVRASINLITGIQRQNRSDFFAFPEGEEDSLVAEVATRLLKNLMKRSMGEYRISEQFLDGVICGEGWLEPYLDYEQDIVNGELKLKKVSALDILVDPAAKEYDLSDARYVIKWTKGLTREQLIQLFPEEKERIENMGIGSGLVSESLFGSAENADLDFNTDYDNTVSIDTRDIDDDDQYDLVEYYYKKTKMIWHVVDMVSGQVLQADSEENANSKRAMLALEGSIIDKIRIVKKAIPEIWHAQLIGDSFVMRNEVAWCYPRFKNFPFIPFFGQWVDVDIKDRHLIRQGIVRSLIDPQMELNKRRTQELRHLNQSANSGWIMEEDAVKNKGQLVNMGGSPGIVVETREGSPAPQKILPTPLSQGHAQLAAEHTQDMKEISGINSDLLATGGSGGDSGRAIHLRQRQGIVQIQGYLDNLGRSRKVLADFLLRMLGEVYDIKEVVNVLGQSYIADNFTEQTSDQILPDGQVVPGEPVVNEEVLVSTIARVLEKTELGKFDVTISEAQNSETMKYANFLTLKDFAEAGFPIPPEVLIDESLISESSKEKIKAAFQKQEEQQLPLKQ